MFWKHKTNTKSYFQNIILKKSLNIIFKEFELWIHDFFFFFIIESYLTYTSLFLVFFYFLNLVFNFR